MIIMKRGIAASENISSLFITMSLCPACQQPLRRTARKPLERSLSYIIPVMRYQCFNAACRWRGLRFNLKAHPLLAPKNKAKGSDHPSI
jgi:hypothetical protein